MKTPKQLRYQNRIYVEPALSSSERLEAITQMLALGRDCLKTGTNGWVAAVFCDAVASGTKLKGEPTQGRIFRSRIRKDPKLKRIMDMHIELDKSKWIYEDMYDITPGNDPSFVTYPSYRGGINSVYIWTYRNGNMQLCDPFGDLVDEPVPNSPPLGYWECTRLRSDKYL